MNGGVLAKILHRLLPAGARIFPILKGPLRGRRFCANVSQRPHYYIGHYESLLVRTIIEVLQPGQVAYDIGANAGYLSLIMGKQVIRGGKVGQVYSFEPAPNAFQILVTNSLLNRDLPVATYQLALSDKLGIEKFSFFEYDLVSRLGDFSDEYADAQVTLTRTAPLDQFVTDFGLRPPDFVKIDVEGAEVQVLKGMMALLKERHPTLLMEIHGPEIETEVLGILSLLGYRSCVLSQDSPKHMMFTAESLS